MKLNNYWFIFQDGNLLLTADNAIPSDIALISTLQAYILREQNIGIYEGIECHFIEITSEWTVPTTLQRLSLRKALDVIESLWFNIAARAASLLNWNKTHRYCGSCGKPTEQTKITEKYCANCNLIFYPRISPSVIVLIKKGEEILMARGPHFTPGAYGLIAGFVEAGESLEDAIHREVKEEVNIKIKNICYSTSQAWPFPDSLMIGFYAEYESGDLIIDHNEIETAGWYHYTNLPGRPAVKNSIASKL